jgi:isopenicillin-N epimerase
MSEVDLAPLPASRGDFWALHPGAVFLNHGSFGACPRPVLARQDSLRMRLEANPVRFFLRDVAPRWEQARARVARELIARPEDVVLVPNATFGVTSVLRSLALDPGDQLLTTDHAYNAVRAALEEVASRAGAEVVVAPLPFPCPDRDVVVERVMERVTERTRLAVIDHVTSPSAFVLPVERLVPALQDRGVDVLVDGAHAPGMLELDLTSLGAAYYTGNGHKWWCAPKGVGFLHAREDRQEGLLPAVYSHGLNTEDDRPPFHRVFDWLGTMDPTPALCLPTALDAVGGLAPGGLPAVRTRGRALARAATRYLCERLRVKAACPEEMLGTMATLELPPDPSGAARWDTSPRPLQVPQLQTDLFEEYGVEVVIGYWPREPQRYLRISAAPYNSLQDYETLADALLELEPSLGS